MLNPLLGIGEMLNLELAAVMARAANDWLAAEWLDRDPRLRASIVVPYEDPPAAAAEIDRVAGDPRFVQVLMLSRTIEPMGRRRYWPIYEACERHGLPLGVHNGGWGGHPITPAGFPSYYIEDAAAMAGAFQAQVGSLLCEGVLTRFPGLRFVLIEGGFAWLPPLMWRLDRAWRMLGAEVPALDRLPSELIRERFWVSTQPMEEPERPAQFHELLEQLADDRPDHVLDRLPALGLRLARPGAPGPADRRSAAHDPARERGRALRPADARQAAATGD